MAEHDADRDEGREPEDGSAPADQAPPSPEPVPAFDEEAVWRQIVEGYGEEPPDPPGARPFRSVEDLALLESFDFSSEGGSPARTDKGEKDKQGKKDDEKPAESGKLNKGEGDESGTKTPGDPDPAKDPGATEPSDKPDDAKPEASSPAAPLGASVRFAPNVGPRDHSLKEPSEKDFDADDEGHFVPPEPPPLPAADTTARFAWLGALGGPLLMLLAVLLGWDMTWWLTTLCIGGFLGGIATLVVRMRDGDDEDDDPGRGAVV